jgi:small subunit ribosomal protein S16
MCIKLFLHGHANRPFFHIAITNKFAKHGTHPVEQLGTYDPMPNKDNQKLVSLNIERVRYWMGQGAEFSLNTARLLGRVGFLPVHPTTYAEAWRHRYKEAADAEAKRSAEGDGQASGTTQPPSSSS